ncbi:MAG TPA: ATP-binding protein [Vicinamibacterales bacterium]|jgi:signal transduction histidine kinase|nr:ATP-binding protein [Vicinamibacterales bacterium]
MFRTWPIAAVGLVALLLVVIVSVLTASRRADEIYSQLEALNAHHREVDARLRQLRGDLSLSGIFIRDYLLDSEREHALDYRKTLLKFRRDNMAELLKLRTLVTSAEEQTRIDNLQAKLDDYWEVFEPLFDWTAVEKSTQSFRFLRREILPRREAALAIAQDIEQFNNANLAAQRAEVTRRFADFQRGLHALLWQSLALGVLVALTAVIRLRIVERRTVEQKLHAEEAERQLRELSQQLVATQEEERKKLSRELHDHVGQMLTALRMELGRIDRARGPVAAEIPAAVAECRQLVDNVVRTVRDLSLGLRPSMLDDFGLQPALEWHIRDVSRRYGLTVDLTTHGDLETLPEPHRTCIYRVVQEALTNCVRHARATRVQVQLDRRGEALEALVSDDGSGFEQVPRPTGLGLRGIEERVRDLKGSVTVTTAPRGGTTIRVVLPLPAPVEVPIANLAG